MESVILPRHEKLYEEVKRRFKDTNFFYYGPYDETFFTHQVYRCARKIMESVDADEELVLVSCLVHDIGKTVLDENLLFKKDTHRKEWDSHPKKGIDLAKEILSGFGYDDEFVGKVCFIVGNHAKRKDFDGIKSVELEIVQDADWIADGGIAGLVRPFLWSASNKKSTLDNIRYVLSEPTRCIDSGVLNLDCSKKISDMMLEDEKVIMKMLKELIML